MAFRTPSVKKLTNRQQHYLQTSYRTAHNLVRLVFKIRTKVHLRPQIKYAPAVPIFMEMRIT
jgi:hypothetical protein